MGRSHNSELIGHSWPRTWALLKTSLNFTLPCLPQDLSGHFSKTHTQPRSISYGEDLWVDSIIDWCLSSSQQCLVKKYRGCSPSWLHCRVISVLWAILNTNSQGAGGAPNTNRAPKPCYTNGIQNLQVQAGMSMMSCRYHKLQAANKKVTSNMDVALR